MEPMEMCKTFVTIQWMTVIPELGSMSFLFYSLYHDFRSWDAGSLSILLPNPPGQDTARSNNIPIILNLQHQKEILDELDINASKSGPRYLNCSYLLAEGETRANYRREVSFGILNFIFECFFFWISCLYLCTHWCVSQRKTCWAAWTNFCFAFGWFFGGISTLVSFLMQNAEDKEKKHDFCVAKSETHSKYLKCGTLLCQASSAKLVSFGLAIFSCWLHFLCFIVAIEQYSKERKLHRNGNHSKIGSGSNTSTLNSPAVSETSATASKTGSTASISNSNSKLPMAMPMPTGDYFLPLTWNVNKRNYGYDQNNNNYYTNDSDNNNNIINNSHCYKESTKITASAIKSVSSSDADINIKNCFDDTYTVKANANGNYYSANNNKYRTQKPTLIESKHSIRSNSNNNSNSELELGLGKTRSKKLVRFKGLYIKKYQKDYNHNVSPNQNPNLNAQQKQPNSKAKTYKNKNKYKNSHPDSDVSSGDSEVSENEEHDL